MGIQTPPPIRALALDAAVLGTEPAAWLEVVRGAEAAGIDLATLADAHHGRVARLDAALLSAWLGARTSTIGLLPEINTTVTEPFLVASQIATLDVISSGRGGWLAQVSANRADSGYVGPRPVAVGEAGWAEAAEYAEVLARLWDSWEDDAEIRDVERHRFIDADRVHPIDFDGHYLKVRGPSITPRPPQGRPPLALTVTRDPRVVDLAAAAGAEIVFVDEARGGSLAAVRARVPDARVCVDVALDAPLVDVDALEGIALARGYDGVRIFAAGAEVSFISAREVNELGTLRERLGLGRPASRYAGARR